MQTVLEEGYESDEELKTKSEEVFERQANDPVVAKELRDFEKAIALWNFYNKARKSITPQSGAGSQNNSTKAQVALANEIIRMAEKIEVEWEG